MRLKVAYNVSTNIKSYPIQRLSKHSILSDFNFCHKLFISEVDWKQVLVARLKSWIELMIQCRNKNWKIHKTFVHILVGHRKFEFLNMNPDFTLPEGEVCRGY